MTIYVPLSPGFSSHLIIRHSGHILGDLPDPLTYRAVPPRSDHILRPVKLAEWYWLTPSGYLRHTWFDSLSIGCFHTLRCYAKLLVAASDDFCAPLPGI